MGNGRLTFIIGLVLRLRSQFFAPWPYQVTSTRKIDTLSDKFKQCCSRLKAENHTSETCLAQTGHRIKQFIDAAKHNAVARFEEWKKNHEIAKIEKHADLKQQPAVDAIALAAFALLEAEVAIMEVLKARKTDLEVAG